MYTILVVRENIEDAIEKYRLDIDDFKHRKVEFKSNSNPMKIVSGNTTWFYKSGKSIKEEDLRGFILDEIDGIPYSLWTVAEMRLKKNRNPSK